MPNCNENQEYTRVQGSLSGVLPLPIQLQDHETISGLSYISNVDVGDSLVVEGQGGAPYLVWCIKITINDSVYSSIVKYKRYSEIEKFRNCLLSYHRDFYVPLLPPKDSWNPYRYLFTKEWLEERRKGLQWFLTYVLLNPRLQKSPIIVDFLLH